MLSLLLFTFTAVAVVDGVGAFAVTVTDPSRTICAEKIEANVFFNGNKITRKTTQSKSGSNNLKGVRNL